MVLQNHLIHIRIRGHNNGRSQDVCLEHFAIPMKRESKETEKKKYLPYIVSRYELYAWMFNVKKKGIISLEGIGVSNYLHCDP